MSTPTVEEYLKHYGTKGMRWGVRKSLSTSGDAKEAGGLAGRAKIGGAAHLSNDEIGKVIKRMELEKKYTELKGDGYKQKGLKFAGKLAKTGAKILLASLLKDTVTGQRPGTTAYTYAYAGARILGAATRAIRN